MTDLEPTEYMPRDDESEARQLQDLGGLGDVLYSGDDAVRDYALGSLGININRNFSE
jgi:hypothetical protein